MSSRDPRRAPLVVLVFVAGSLAASAIPGLAGVLEYERQAVSHGEIWRLATGQLVHWSFAMTALDLGLVAIAGSVLELRSRRVASLAVALAVAFVAVAVQAWAAPLEHYRGSSGFGWALAAALAVDLARRAENRYGRGTALAIALALAAKLAWELATGSPLPFDHLPAGVAVVPQAHAAGAVAGLVAALVSGPRIR